MKVRVGTIDVRYRIQGSGPVLLLVAGTGYPGATWPAGVLEPLARSYTVLTYDHRGTGDTPGTDGPYSTELFARDALGLLKGLGVQSAHVLGHSMGGRVAQWMAVRDPDRVRSLVLAASGPGPIPGSTGHSRGISVQAAAAMVELGYRDALRQTQRDTFFTEAFVAQHPDVVEELAEAFWNNRPTLIDYLKHVEARQQHDTVDRLSEISQRTLVLVGDADTHRRGTGSHLEQSRYLARSLPSATLHELAGLKHGFFWERPQESVEAVMQWLAQVASPDASPGAIA